MRCRYQEEVLTWKAKNFCVVGTFSSVPSCLVKELLIGNLSVKWTYAREKITNYCSLFSAFWNICQVLHQLSLKSEDLGVVVRCNESH